MHEQLHLFLQHMTSPGNNGASYSFVDVHVSADSIKSKAAAATKHRGYGDACLGFAGTNKEITLCSCVTNRLITEPVVDQKLLRLV